MSRYGHDDPGEPRRNKLYRNKRDGMIAGVCAGFADYFGFDLGMTRVLLVIAAFTFFPMLILVYFVLALILKPAPPRFEEPQAEREPGLGRRVRAEPHATLSSVRHRFRDLDGRLQRLEKYVTSERFRLDREFAGLKE
ncbi:MAG TPA: envelope stress response membrane protein PspC [Gammaproteobacteria bacterium]|jgi:phage shock protein C